MERLELGSAYRRALADLRSWLSDRLDGTHAWSEGDPSLGELLATLLECGERSLADRALAELLARQRADGSWGGSGDRSDEEETAHALRGLLAARASRPVTETAIRKASEWRRRRGPSGESASRAEPLGAAALALAWQVGSPRASRELLEAIHARIEDAFSGQVGGFEDRIRRGDGRFAFLLTEAGPLAGQRVLDAGCGRGALARAVLTAYPSALLMAVDLSPGMLAHASEAAPVLRASIQNLPFEDASFDVAYCVEALEHACNPEGAIDELCRVVRRGGRVLIVDKNAERSGALEIEEWERWFGRREVEGWLGRHCVEVSSSLLLHCLELGPDLFVGWRGTRR